VSVDPSSEEPRASGGERNPALADEEDRRGDRADGTRRARDGGAPRPTLNAAVRRRRTDRAFYIRIAGAIRQNERALERLKR
jgi:hypothetical protein